MTMEQLMMMLQKRVREINERKLMISAVHQDVRHVMNTGSDILHGVPCIANRGRGAVSDGGA
jgi:hypothetical protein